MLSPTARRFAFIKWTLITTFSLPLLYWFSVQPEASIVAKYKSILSKYKNGLSKYKSIASKYKSIASKYKSILSKYKSKLSKYKSLLSKYKSLLSKYKFYLVQSNFWNLGNGISETRNFLNTSDSRNPVPRAGSVQTLGTEPNPSQLIEHRNLRNLGHATFWTQNLGNASGPEPGVPKTEPGTLEQQNLSEPSKRVAGSRNWFPEPQNLSPGTRSRNPVPSQNRPSSPRTHRNLYCAKTP